MLAQGQWNVNIGRRLDWVEELTHKQTMPLPLRVYFEQGEELQDLRLLEV